MSAEPTLQMSELRKALYAGGIDVVGWLKRVCQALVETAELPRGALARWYQLQDDSLLVHAYAATEDFPFDIHALDEHIESEGLFKEFVRASRRLPQVTTLQRLASEERGGVLGRVISDFLAQHGLRDMLILTAPDGRGGVITVCAPFPDVVALDDEMRRRWGWVSVHLSAAKRIRNWGVPLRDEVVGIGEEDVALPTLREHSVPSDKDELWRKLVDGTWTFKMTFTSAGRRLLIAAQREEGPVPLSEREREVTGLAAMGHSNKIIAYQLDLTQSTVSSHLRNAMSKLGLASRIELVQAVNHLVDEQAYATTLDLGATSSVDVEAAKQALLASAREVARLRRALEGDPELRSAAEELREQLEELENLLGDGDED